LKRHPSLHPLSQHHHFALIQALEMKRAAAAPVAKRSGAVEHSAKKFVRFWHSVGAVHFREEEEVLLPAFARITRLDEDAEIMRMLADHAEIRAVVLEFEKRFAENLPIETDTVAHLAKLLHDHVRLEENQIFPRMEKALGEAGLSSMGQRLTRLHKKDDVCEF
jgi:hemerythrin-like domain-containing protein